MGSGLVGLPVRHVICSLQGLARRAVPAGSVGPQMSKHQKHMLTIQEPSARAVFGVGALCHQSPWP